MTSRRQEGLRRAAQGQGPDGKPGGLGKVAVGGVERGVMKLQNHLLRAGRRIGHVGQAEAADAVEIVNKPGSHGVNDERKRRIVNWQSGANGAGDATRRRRSRPIVHNENSDTVEEVVEGQGAGPKRRPRVPTRGIRG